MMTEERYFRILEVYGADPARWPDAERADAEAFAAANPVLVRDATGDEMVLDDLLDRLMEPTLDAPLLERRLLSRLPTPSALPAWMAPSAVGQGRRGGRRPACRGDGRFCQRGTDRPGR